ncbi:MAG: hypothetical protein STSR0002_10220 [Smithella sp.]|jgi:hypothetical protein
MKKESLICFRASKALHKALARVAKEDRRSLSSTIENALNNYLKERKAFPDVEKEKRQHPRKALSASAVINQPESGQMGIGAIADISLGGVRILIPKDFKQQILIDEQNSKFEIVFNLPVENKPIRLSCESNRVDDAEDSIHVGASFVDADFKNYKALQTYLM